MKKPGNTLARLTMRHLRLLDALSRAGSVHQAAKELRLSQPAASNILRDLENLLEQPLFTRSSRGMAANEFGQYVLGFARRMLNETSRFQEGLNNIKSGGFGTLSIGTILDSSPRFLPRVIAALITRRPLIRIHVTEGSSGTLMSALEQNRHDLVLARYTNTEQPFIFDMTPLREEPLSIFVSNNHPLAKRKTVTPEETLRYPWMVPPEGTPTRQFLDRTFTALGLQLPIVVETGSLTMTLHLVKAMYGVSVLPRDIIDDQLQSGHFHALPIDLGVTLPPFGIIKRKDAELSENAALFVELTKEMNADTLPPRQGRARKR